MADEHEDPSPSQAELNAMNRAVFGHADEKPKKAKAEPEAEKVEPEKAEKVEKAATAEAPSTYKTRQAKSE